MKFTTILIIVLAIIAFGFIALQAFSMSSTNRTEMYAYKVLERYDDFEVRQYEPAVFSYVKMESSSYEENSSQGFRTLAGYIFGGNERDQKIAMTTPVAMEMDDSVTMSFMVPSDMDMEELPSPNDQRIGFKKEPAKVVAAIRFGGWSNDQKIEEHKQKLAAALEREGIPHTGKFTYLGYNPPYQMVDRRNEVVVEVEGFDQKNQ